MTLVDKVYTCDWLWTEPASCLTKNHRNQSMTHRPPVIVFFVYQLSSLSYSTFTGEQSYCPGPGISSLDSINTDDLLVKDRKGA